MELYRTVHASELIPELDANGKFTNNYRILTDQLPHLPNYPDRATILREEFIPSDYRQYWCVNSKNEHYIIYLSGSQMPGQYVVWYGAGLRFALHEDEAEEIVAIRKGEWLPKVGNEFCYCNIHGYCLSGIERYTASSGRMFSALYFPSIKQRDEFIAKNKPKEIELLFTLHNGQAARIMVDKEGYLKAR